MLRKIDAMHERFGVVPDKRCGECSNLISGRYNTRYLSKCVVYGATHSEASDWKKRNMACGMFNKEWNGYPIIRRLTPDKAEPVPEIEGQESLFDAQE